MAVATKTDHPGATFLHTWNLTTADPVGDAIEFPGAADRTVQFVGTNWGGSTAVLEGSLDGGDTYFTLTDPQGNTINKTSNDGEAVTENTLLIRSRLSVIGTAAAVAARLMSRSTMR